MNIIIKYKPLLFISPFLIIMALGKVLDLFPNKREINKYHEELSTFLSEEGLNSLLIRANITNTNLLKFQTIRIILSVILSAPFLLLEQGIRGITIFIIVVVCVYKYFYVYLVSKEKTRIKKLNKELPYGIKTIVYLNYIYPVTNALEKSINYVPDSFKNDLVLLIKDIDQDPNTYQPYQNFINRYDGKLEQLDFYLRILYRMSISSKDEEKLLGNMNSSISGEINRVRQMKNDATNSTIQYLGMLPVVLVTMMLTYVLVIVSGTI